MDGTRFQMDLPELKLPFRLGKPTGEALIGKTFANRKTSAPAGRASRGPVGKGCTRTADAVGSPKIMLVFAS